MKIFAAGLLAEINTFCPMLTTEQHFAECYLKRGGDHGEKPHYWAAPLAKFAQLAKLNNWQYVESLCAGAQPAGPVLDKVYEAFRDEILEDLQKAMPVDIVLLNLHGAMVAENYDDCEGDLLQHIRTIVGPSVVIGALFDPHTHLTEKMLANANVLLWLKEYPHIDSLERAEELFKIVTDTALGKIHPHMSTFDCRMIALYATTIEPMKSYVSQLKSLEGKNDIISVSLVHGFPWADIADMGTKILVITNNQPEKGLQLAEKLGHQLWELKGKTFPRFYSIDEAIDDALKTKNYPIVFADFSDNVGGGAFGDSTFILKALLERKITNVAISSIWDPIATQLAASAGEGSLLSLRIGGKMGSLSGDPIDLKVRVSKIVPELTATLSGGVFHYGTAVALHTNGIDVIINSIRCQTYSTDCFIKMGINPSNKQILVVKSSEHFRESFKKISDRILTVAAPGLMSPEFEKIQYSKLQRKMWPINL